MFAIPVPRDLTRSSDLERQPCGAHTHMCRQNTHTQKIKVLNMTLQKFTYHLERGGIKSKANVPNILLGTAPTNSHYEEHLVLKANFH